MAVRCEYQNSYQRFFESSTQETLHVNAPQFEKHHFSDTALIAVDGTAYWTAALVNGGTAACAASAGGHLLVTTGAADDDDNDFASALDWYASAGCCVEAKIAITDESGTAFNFGFSDATGEAADKIACTYNGTTLTSNASDCALFFHDPDATTDLPRCVAVKGDTDGTVTTAGAALADTIAHTYRVECLRDGLGTVDFFFDGNHIYQEALGITAATPLCIYFGLINREAAANTALIHYIAAWQGR